MLGLLLIVAGSFFYQSYAWETDQFTNRNHALQDSLEVMNRKINRHIQRVVQSWDITYGTDENLLVYKVYKEISKSWLINSFETWLEQSKKINRLYLEQHIYSDAPIYGSRGNYFFNLSPTIVVGNVRLGTDKPGHFFSEGYRYFKIAEVDGKGEQAARDSGVFSEIYYFGYLVSGVYSNADLVSNYEGYRFYKSLVHDNIIPGKKAIIGWQHQVPYVQRLFNFADHITEYWDEALNPSHFVPALQEAVAERLKNLCDLYWSKPHLFIPQNEVELEKRYHHIGLVKNTSNRLDHFCLGIL